MPLLITERLNKKLLKRIANFFLFYIGWGFCLAGAVSGDLYKGPLIVAFFVFYHLVMERFRLSEVYLVLSLGVFGTLLDSLFLNLGFIDYLGGYPGAPFIAPLWVTSIWCLFASSVTPSFGWLRANIFLAAIFGFGGGFASYFAAARVGAATFYPGMISVSVGVGVVWFFLMPAILRWASFLEERFPSAPQSS